MPSPARPITVALVDDYDVVLKGLAHLFDDYRDRVIVAEIDANAPVSDSVDVVLYDSFAQPEADHVEIAELLRNPRARRVVVYTWNFHPDPRSPATRACTATCRRPSAPQSLVTAIEAVHAGARIFNDQSRRAPSQPGLDWPGKREGITDRESEILALITQGKSNAEIARLTYLSPNTVKSYIRSVYRKIGATSRTQAVLYGVRHGFTPDTHRIDHWLGGP
ncbi:response regulator transcription factor [Microbacterium lacticum]|uniref:response regulator transcription factor n=1 Tax=Microbacterium lacticum TaxID=33885 RepID=UPI0028CFE101|nr:response regulator transcription factor [Microbacterium lacticum]